MARLSVSATPGAGVGASVSLGQRPQAASPFAHASAPARAFSDSAFGGGAGGGVTADFAGGGGKGVGSPPASGGGGFQPQSLPPNVRERLGASHASGCTRVCKVERALHLTSLFAHHGL